MVTTEPSGSAGQGPGYRTTSTSRRVPAAPGAMAVPSSRANRTAPTVVGRSMRLQRGDLGLLVGAVLAVVLIGTFLAATSGSPEEDADDRGEEASPATTATTAAPRSEPVRIRSDA